MNSLLDHSLLIIIPLVLTNTIHMLLVKYEWLLSLNIPISDKLFGRNKTWRGFLFLIVVNALFVLLLVKTLMLPIKNPVLLGAILGFTYLVFELPNSYMKRRLGIAPGEKHHKYRLIFSLIDKSDSSFGLSFVYCSLGYVDWKSAVLLYFICSFSHIFFSLVLVKFKIKSSF